MRLNLGNRDCNSAVIWNSVKKRAGGEGANLSSEKLLQVLYNLKGLLQHKIGKDLLRIELSRF